MKTVSVISYLIGLAVIFTACSEPDPVITNEEDVYQELSMSAELAGQAFAIRDGSTIDLTGTTTNCNLAGNTCISVYGIVRNLQEGNFAIDHGSLRILAPDKGCYLTGNFDGWGRNFFTDDVAMGATVQVYCGTGDFKADGGELQLKITGMDSNGNYKAEIFGHLKRIEARNAVD